jgi:NAD(P)-dependent dehydrogenase (short-subunit alcohol dehydrogenase family)
VAFPGFKEMEMGDLLKDRVAIVTGGGRGIGRQEALALSAEGAEVVVNDYGVTREGDDPSSGPAHEVVEEIKGLGGQAVACSESVADFGAAGRIIQTALDSFGRLDILVNNAGVFRHKLMLDHTEDDWDSVIAVHLKGTFNTCRHAIPVMKDRGYGRIINTTSSQWRNPEGRLSYAAAKGGVVSLTWDLAWELRNYGITCNAIAPMGQTRMYQASGGFHEVMTKAGLLRAKRLDEIEDRPGPEFVPPMVVYLASDLAPQVTGCIFRVGAGKVAIYSHPTEARGIYKDYHGKGPWTLDELERLLPGTVLAGGVKAPHIPQEDIH